MTILKKSLGDAGAFFDDSNGQVGSRLYDVLKALAEGLKFKITGYQAAVATGVMAQFIADGGEVLDTLRVDVTVCGSANTTTIQARVNGTAVQHIDVANTETDPFASSIDLGGVVLEEGDVVDINVSAAATGATGVKATISARAVPVVVE